MRTLTKTARFFCVEDTQKRSPLLLFEDRKLHYQSTSKLLADPDFMLKMRQRYQNCSQPLSVYCGYDPTAPSLHLGNLISIIMMARLQYFLNFRPIFVLGGATGQIGDPSGKSQQRNLLQAAAVAGNMQNIIKQIDHIFSSISEDLNNNNSAYGIKSNHEQMHPHIFIDNFQFYNEMKVIDFLRNVGKHMGMSSLLAKETVANRLEGSAGISYTEFTYTLLQSYDFYRLNRDYGCILQFGGSDQWGNITNGCSLTRKMSSNTNEVFGITMPLLLTKTGQKFGKSEGNALFLDDKLTPLSTIYDYFYSQADEDVERLLHIFTFYSLPKISEIMATHAADPSKRVAQKILASKITQILGSYTNIKQQLLKLSEQQLKSKSQQQLENYYSQLPHQMLIDFNPHNQSINCLPDLLCSHNITKTKKQARRQIKANGIYINNKQVSIEYSNKALQEIITQNKIGDFMLIRRGKKKYYMIKFINTILQ